MLLLLMSHDDSVPSYALEIFIMGKVPEYGNGADVVTKRQVSLQSETKSTDWRSVVVGPNAG